eukprot:TRINITY_DN59079_c0_g1_i1.p1 TRINITY_DN59079_c0_g1~~TRINITY_DN59079_c0_g1_i1.p1  ORF type:complete len:524 (+),score=121.21 TRINITY_DN59079_c0_g1_i1:144-1715(+)
MASRDESAVRRHGFEMPLHPLQVVGFVVFGFDVFVYAFFGLPLLASSGALPVIAVAYAVSVVSLVIAALRATLCDPSDPRLFGRGDATSKEGDLEFLPYCTICSVPVNPRSKHCRECNKCVDVFDHHCMWLNNCVGAANYGAFFGTISSVAAMTSILLATCLFLFLDFILNPASFEERVPDVDVFRDIPQELSIVVLVLLVLLNTPLFLLDVQLLVLHCFLMSQQLTTYEYIQQKRDEQDAREAGQSSYRTDDRKPVSVSRSIMRKLDWIVFCRCGRRRKRQQPDLPPHEEEEEDYSAGCDPSCDETTGMAPYWKEGAGGSHHVEGRQGSKGKASETRIGAEAGGNSPSAMFAGITPPTALADGKVSGGSSSAAAAERKPGLHPDDVTIEPWGGPSHKAKSPSSWPSSQWQTPPSQLAGAMPPLAAKDGYADAIRTKPGAKKADICFDAAVDEDPYGRPLGCGIDTDSSEFVDSALSTKGQQPGVRVISSSPRTSLDRGCFCDPFVSLMFSSSLAVKTAGQPG